MLTIRYTRIGKKQAPVFRLVVTEHKNPIQGKFLEILGFYNPVSKETKINKEKILHWLNQGAKPSNSVARFLKNQKIEHKLIIVKEKHKKTKKKESSSEGRPAEDNKENIKENVVEQPKAEEPKE